MTEKRVKKKIKKWLEHQCIYFEEEFVPAGLGIHGWVDFFVPLSEIKLGIEIKGHKETASHCIKDIIHGQLKSYLHFCDKVLVITHNPYLRGHIRRFLTFSEIKDVVFVQDMNRVLTGDLAILLDYWGRDWMDEGLIENEPDYMELA